MKYIARIKKYDGRICNISKLRLFSARGFLRNFRAVFAELRLLPQINFAQKLLPLETLVQDDLTLCKQRIKEAIWYLVSRELKKLFGIWYLEN